MNASEPFRLRLKLPQPKTRFGAALKNVIMFLSALAVTAGLGTVLNDWLIQDAGDDGYYLETRRPLRVGDVLSAADVSWQPVTGREPAGTLTVPDRSGTNVFGRTVLRPVLIGRPIPSNSLAFNGSAGSGSLELEPGEVAFVMAGAETEAVTGFVSAGDHVNVIAVLGTERRDSLIQPSVGTVVQGARVVAVRPAEGRGRNALTSTLAIAMSRQEAEDLAAWRYEGELVVSLTGDLTGLDQEVRAWRPLYQVAPAAVPEDGSYYAEEVPVEAAAGAETSAPSIEIVSPAGVRIGTVQ